jgi:malate dehydrogenase (quinone)
MLKVIQRCFEEAGTAAWQTKLKAIIPSFGQSLAKDASLSGQVISRTTCILRLSEERAVS